jgi:hypothetical protein
MIGVRGRNPGRKGERVMGWSCSLEASETLKRLDATCRDTTGSSNTWKLAGREFFYEMSRREYDDGAITGAVIELGSPTHCDNPRCSVCNGARPGRKIGTFRVNGDGTIARMPSVMRKAMAGD